MTPSTATAMTSERLSFKEKAGYGCGDLASVLFWQTLTANILYFYTDVFGIAAVTAGTMMLVTRLLDAVFDPIIGMIADRTNTRWGKYRPYLVWMTVPLSISAVAAFVTPSFGPSGKLAYAFATLVIFMFLYSAINIPYGSLLGVISSNPAERTKASSFKSIGAFTAGAIVSWTALPLAREVFGKGDEARGWPLTMAVYAIASTALFLVTFAATKERVQPQREHRGNVRQDLGDLLTNIPWVLIVITTILMLLFVAIRITVTVHYFKYYVGDQSVSLFGATRNMTFVWLASAFNGIGQICAVVGTLLVPWFARLVGKKLGFILLFIGAAGSTGAFYFLSPQDVGWIFFLQVIGSLTGGPLTPLIWAMYADTADYSEWKTKRRATGLVFSAASFAQKLTWAGGSALAGVMLSYFGFVANETQNANVLEGLKAMMSWIPAGAGVLAILVVLFYRLDEPFMKKISAELQARRAAAQAEAPGA